MRFLLAAAATALMTAAAPADAQAPQMAAATPPTASSEDPYLWLEDIEGERSIGWVKQRNERSLGVLQADSRYGRNYDAALKILEATDRIPNPGFANDAIDNFWQDATNVRGLWRRTTLDSYRTDAPRWDIILDVDKLNAAEKANWVYRGANCLEPELRYCLVALSNGGKDAVELREFDVETKSFVPSGFRLPESKGGASWLDRDTLLISRDFGPGTLTNSGYPFVVKRLKRGQSLDQAQEVYRGRKEDVAAGGSALRDADGRLQAVLMSRSPSFYESEYRFLTDGDRLVRVPFPAKAEIETYVQDQLVFTINEPWRGFKLGDLLSYDLSELKADPDKAKPTLVHSPGPREAVQGVTATRGKLLVVVNENVKGAAYVYDRGAKGWTRRRLDLPRNATVGLGSASDENDRVFLSVTNYLTPTTLYLADAATGRVEKAKTSPERFNAANHVVEQFQATSKDGTKIPYFVVRPKTAKTDGSNPTLLYGYGGYQNSLLPGYSGVMGKLWLENGGTYVVANTRGGGEFGPSWHQAALGKNRQRAHEDFQAVAEDVIARKLTSPRRLGIMGGSQGGLFMGVAMTQRPELFNAAVIQVPLFDMLRFHKLLAGNSWMAEYGNPDIPEQRAWIEAYSPYQALAAGKKYPEPFILTSTKDDRVHPGHARKAAARLEELGYPFFYYENTDGGHSAAANLRETAKRQALEYTYLARKLMD